AGVSIPLWANQKQANQVTEAEKNLAAAQAKLSARRREIDTQLNTLFNQIERMESQLRLVDQGMIPQARLALKANLAAYQAGKGDYLMLLDSFMALYDHRMEAVMWRAEHEKMIGMLEAQLGISLNTPNPSKGAKA
ncbi:MAG: TolC family protein, partial [Bacteroidota bacterium]